MSRKMTVNEIRKRFLKFFEGKDHRVFPSDSLVPESDPTLLFTGAGMNQFKEYFLGKKKGLRRAASCQKCLRTGDLDRVGHTAGHHTFFEMLGNFSFGDYFKEEAILWAWEFLTKDLSLPPGSLAVSVYEEDREAYDIWLKKIKVPKERILKFGPKENFWPSNVQREGPNGPCGPCSEIFFDWEPKRPILYDEKRFVEVWNLVFTQFNRQEDGSLKDLPAKNIDTGMGLERMAAVMQGVRTNFEMDGFHEPISFILKEAKMKAAEGGERRAWVNRIADHARAVSFAVLDGVIPSNKERGYVVRTLIRRASFSARILGIKTPFLFQVVPLVAKAMREGYPDLWEGRDRVSQVVLNEEESFERTLEEGLSKEENLLEEVLRKRSRILPGKDVFYLYDTLGLPLDLIRYAAEQKKIALDDKGFEEALGRQRARSKVGSQMKGEIFGKEAMKKKELDLKTTFVGYETCRLDRTEVIAIFREGEPVDEVKAGDTVDIFLKTSPFYGEQGGQIGDTGLLESKTVRVRIEDTQHFGEALMHLGKVEKGTLKKGDAVSATVDETRRQDIMKNHTATHLLHSALRELLGSHVQQAGSWVGQERLRFDFRHPRSLGAEEIRRVEERVNEHILRNDPVMPEWMSREESRKKDAIAFFGEKYGEKVRVLLISDYSKELCGGTHIRSTGEIGQFRIVKESSIGSGVRRIEAVTGWEAYRRARRDEEILQKIASTFKTPREGLLETVGVLQQKLKEKEKAHSQSKQDRLKDSVEKIMASGEEVSGTHFIYYDIGKDFSKKETPSLIDGMRQAYRDHWVAALRGTDEEGKSFYVVGTDGSLSAKEVLSEISEITGGQGGGSDRLAKGGGGDPAKWLSAKGAIKKFIVEKKP